MSTCITKRLFPQPQIQQGFYGLKGLFVYVNEAPYVGNLQVRFCEGH
jgi:hypothetical protein